MTQIKGKFELFAITCYKFWDETVKSLLEKKGYKFICSTKGTIKTKHIKKAYFKRQM